MFMEDLIICLANLACDTRSRAEVSDDRLFVLCFGLRGNVCRRETLSGVTQWRSCAQTLQPPALGYLQAKK